MTSPPVAKPRKKNRIQILDGTHRPTPAPRTWTMSSNKNSMQQKHPSSALRSDCLKLISNVGLTTSLLESLSERKLIGPETKEAVARLSIYTDANRSAADILVSELEQHGQAGYEGLKTAIASSSNSGKEPTECTQSVMDEKGVTQTLPAPSFASAKAAVAGIGWKAPARQAEVRSVAAHACVQKEPEESVNDQKQVKRRSLERRATVSRLRRRLGLVCTSLLALKAPVIASNRRLSDTEAEGEWEVIKTPIRADRHLLSSQATLQRPVPIPRQKLCLQRVKSREHASGSVRRSKSLGSLIPEDTAKPELLWTNGSTTDGATSDGACERNTNDTSIGGERFVTSPVTDGPETGSELPGGPCPTDWQLYQVSQHVKVNATILTEFKLKGLVARLKVSSSVLKANPQVEPLHERFHSALELWKKKNGQHATHNHLLVAFYELKLHSLCNYYETLITTDTAGADDQYYYSMEELAAKFEQHYCCTDIVRNKPVLCLDSRSAKLALLSSDSGNSSS